MALTLRTERDGKTLRPYWYGVYTEDGRRHVVNLNVKLAGTPPASGRTGDLGNALFEDSRRSALAALEHFAENARVKGRAETLTERLIESKTGTKIEHVEIADLFERWVSRDDYSEGYIAQCKALFARFVSFMKERNTSARFLYQVRPSDADTFAKMVRQKFSASTAAAHIGILRPAFARYLPPGAANPFRNIRHGKGRRTSEAASGATVHRKPFTAEQLQALLLAAKNDPFMYPLVVTAVCTGMRRGDVCELKWSAVDLRAGMIQSKTSKTGEPVEIPIFGPLHAVLAGREKTKGGGFVFPDAAEMLETNPDGLSWRFKKIVVKALSKGPQPPALPLDMASRHEIEEKAMGAIETLPVGGRRERIADNFRRYMAGESVRQIVKRTGRAKGTVSDDLNKVQQLIGRKYMRSLQARSVKLDIAELTRTPRKEGCPAASVYDWHALRTSFVTLALSANVPMELVRRVTGHATVDIVLRHYFRPGREDFRAALAVAMPDVITGRKSSALPPADEMTVILSKIAGGSATEDDKERLRFLASKV